MSDRGHELVTQAGDEMSRIAATATEASAMMVSAPTTLSMTLAPASTRTPSPRTLSMTVAVGCTKHLWPRTTLPCARGNE